MAQPTIPAASSATTARTEIHPTGRGRAVTAFRPVRVGGRRGGWPPVEPDRRAEVSGRPAAPGCGPPVPGRAAAGRDFLRLLMAPPGCSRPHPPLGGEARIEREPSDRIHHQKYGYDQEPEVPGDLGQVR